MGSLWETMLLRWLGRPGAAEAPIALPWTPLAAPSGGFEVRRAAASGRCGRADGPPAAAEHRDRERVPG